ncbi:MAG: hypothetical protein ACJ8CB_19235 [Ktedonobacteraceae bacterium]
MQQPFTLPADNPTSNRRQAYALLLLGVVFLIIAWLGILNPYPLGVLLFGLGMLGVAPLNPRRFLSTGWLMTSLGVATFLMFRHSIPGSQLLTAHLLAIGVGLLGIAWMARRGCISTGTLTPGLFVVGVGVTEYLQAAHLTPASLLPFALSLWLPGSGLFVLGLVSLATSGRTYLNAKRHPANRTQTPVQRGTTAMHPVKGSDK